MTDKKVKVVKIKKEPVKKDEAGMQMFKAFYQGWHSLDSAGYVYVGDGVSVNKNGHFLYDDEVRF